MTTPMLLFVGAIGFDQAAQAISERPMPSGEIHWPALNVNACFAIELALKSFVLHQSGDEKLLKRIGHDLSEALSNAIILGLPAPSSTVKEIVDALSVIHRSSGFRYLAGDWMELYDPVDLLRVTGSIISAVGHALPLDDFR